MASKMVGVDRIPSLINQALEPLRSERLISRDDWRATKKILQDFEGILGIKGTDLDSPSTRIAHVDMGTTAALRALGDIAESRLETQAGSGINGAAPSEDASNVEIEQAVALRRQALKQLVGLAGVLGSLGRLDQSVLSALQTRLEADFRWIKSEKGYDTLRAKIGDNNRTECVVVHSWADKANKWDISSLRSFDQSFAGCVQGTKDTFERMLGTLIKAASGIKMTYDGLETQDVDLLKAVAIARRGVIVADEKGSIGIVKASLTYTDPSGCINGYYISSPEPVTKKMINKRERVFVLLERNIDQPATAE